MWMNILMSVITSEMTKKLIALGVQKLLDHTKDGVTKDIAKTMLDGIVQSQANPVKTGTVLSALKMLKD